MGLFKKDEVYDYTLLQKKGYLKTEELKKSDTRVTKDGYFELGAGEIEEKVEVEEGSQENLGEVLQDSNAETLGFFDSFAANSVGTQSSGVGVLESFDAIGNSGVGQGDVKDLSVKLEDFEYKLARIADKLAMIESKIEEFEEKVK